MDIQHLLVTSHEGDSQSPSPASTIVTPSVTAFQVPLGVSPIMGQPFSRLHTIEEATSMLKATFEELSLGQQALFRRAILNGVFSALYFKVKGDAASARHGNLTTISSAIPDMAQVALNNLRLISPFLYPDGRGGTIKEFWPLLAVLRAVLPNMDGSACEWDRLKDHLTITLWDAASGYLQPRGPVELGEHAALSELLRVHEIPIGSWTWEWQVLKDPATCPILGANPVCFEPGDPPGRWIIVGATEAYAGAVVEQSHGQSVPSESSHEDQGHSSAHGTAESQAANPNNSASFETLAEVDVPVTDLVELYRSSPPHVQSACTQVWVRALVYQLRQESRATDVTTIEEVNDVGAEQVAVQGQDLDGLVALAQDAVMGRVLSNATCPFVHMDSAGVQKEFQSPLSSVSCALLGVQQGSMPKRAAVLQIVKHHVMGVFSRRGIVCGTRVLQYNECNIFIGFVIKSTKCHIFPSIRWPGC